MEELVLVLVLLAEAAEDGRFEAEDGGVELAVMVKEPELVREVVVDMEVELVVAEGVAVELGGDEGASFCFLLDLGTLNVSVLDTFPAEGWRAAREIVDAEEEVEDEGGSVRMSFVLLAGVTGVRSEEDAIAIREETASMASSGFMGS